MGNRYARMTWLLRLVVSVAGLLLPLVPVQVHAMEPPAGASVHTYDGQHCPVLLADTTTERGPPATTYGYTAIHSAGGASLHCHSARPHLSSSWTYNDYDRSASPAHGDCTSGTTGTAAVGSVANLRAVRGASVAAKGAATKAGDDVLEACVAGKCGIPGGTCFVAGTLIKTEEGLKPIEDIRVGDKVWAHNFETGEDELRPVDRTYVCHIESLLKLTVGTGTLTTTKDHPFWVEGLGWKRAGELAVGDVLVTPNGRVALESREVLRRAATVYNFRVVGDHNYYAVAGDTPILVHNANYGRADLAFARKVKLAPDNPAVINRGMPVQDFVSEYRNAKILRELPGEYLGMTVEDALRSGNSTVRKLLTDGRWSR